MGIELEDENVKVRGGVLGFSIVFVICEVGIEV